MPHSLHLAFHPAVGRDRILRHFATRNHFSITGNEIIYDNPNTEMGFFINLRVGRDIFLRRTVSEAETSINYYRPSYYGLEAEIEMSAFMAAFRPGVEDPQMRGIGAGPYSREGFLRGWNFGNQFSVYNAISENPDNKIWTMPAEKIRAAWAWNYDVAERRDRLENRRFVPAIQFYVMDGRPCTAVVWALGMPISLPRVEYVLVGRPVAGEKRFGLAPWSEVLDVARRAGFDITKEPLDLEYFVTPPQIAKWVADIPLADTDGLERLSQHRILDTELVEAAHGVVEVEPGVIQFPPQAAE